jgi:hypothetical protein
MCSTLYIYIYIYYGYNLVVKIASFQKNLNKLYFMFWEHLLYIENKQNKR